MKLVINKCYGGFGLSCAAYERLIELGIPVRQYTPQKRGKNGLYKREPLNEGRVIFDRMLEPESGERDRDISFMGRYWDMWIDSNREDALLVQVVQELGERANGQFAKLEVVEIPDDVNYTIEEYDGIEHVAEVHRTWG